jgi:hypothetical protein
MGAGAGGVLATIGCGAALGMGEGLAGIGPEAGIVATGVHVGAADADAAGVPGCHAGGTSAVAEGAGAADWPCFQSA